MRALEVAVRDAGGVAIVGLTGRLSVDEAPVLDDSVNALVKAEKLNIVLDLREVSLIDSAGLGAMVALCVRLRRRGGDLKLLHVAERNAHALHVTRLDSVFQRFVSEDEAVRSF